MDRLGQTSTFPTSLDEFAIKVPYDPDIALSLQHSNSLEKSDHILHYFDAVANLQNEALGNVGYGLVSRYASGITNAESDVVSPNLKISYVLHTISLTGNTATVTGSVPSLFGSTPFENPGFSIGHSTYFSPIASANVNGIWSNTDHGSQGPANEMLSWHQIFTIVSPITGNQYNLTVRNIPFHSTSQAIGDTFTDSMKLFGLPWQFFWEREGWTGEGYGGLYAYPTSNGQTYWQGGNEYGNERRYGWAWSTYVGSVSQSYVEWGEIVDRYATPETGDEVYTRLGPMVRAQGSLASASFYCLSIGDVSVSATGLTGDLGKYSRLLKVLGANLSNEGSASPDGGGLSWPEGTITELPSGYLWVGDSSTRYRLKCETETGSAKITVQSSPSPYSVWSDLYGPFYDGSPLSAGYSGFFSQAMNGDDTRHVQFLGSTSVVSLDTPNALTTQVQLIFMEVGPNSSIPSESDA